jgi:hypothetical protein
VRVAVDHFAVYHSSSEGNEKSSPRRAIVEAGIMRTAGAGNEEETAYEYQT